MRSNEDEEEIIKKCEPKVDDVFINLIKGKTYLLFYNNKSGWKKKTWKFLIRV